MPTYRVADASIDKLVTETMEQHHPDLIEAGVTVSALFADELLHRGMPAKATIKVNSAKDRVEGKADATITIDEPTWEDMPEEERTALLDDTLEYLLLIRDEAGRVKTDHAERPRMNNRQPDFELRGFWNVTERHKEAAPEAVAYKPIQHGFRQRLLFEDS